MFAPNVAIQEPMSRLPQARWAMALFILDLLHSSCHTAVKVGAFHFSPTESLEFKYAHQPIRIVIAVSCYTVLPRRYPIRANTNTKYSHVHTCAATPSIVAPRRFGQPGVNYALLPRTLSALRRLPLAPETAAFQRQLPGTGLPLHVDPSNFVLGCHLGIDVPPAADVDASSVRDLDSVRGGKTTGRRYASPGRSSGTGFGGGGGGRPAVDSGERSAKCGERGRRKGGGDNRGKACSAAGTASTTSVVPRRVDDGKKEEPKSVGGPAVVAGDGKGLGGSDASTTVVASTVSESLEGGNRARVENGGGAGERAWIEVAGEKRNWETGGAFVFDPSFLHRTHNPTLGERVILNVDIWHPGLEDVEKTAICRVCELVEHWNARSGLFAE